MIRSFTLNLSLLVILGAGACAPVPAATETQALPNTEAPPETPSNEEVPISEPKPTPTKAAVTETVPVTGHLMTPGEVVPAPRRVVYDVVSSGDSAPYGDSYRLNRLERPFHQDMTYVPELDIVSFEVSEDADWNYVSIKLKASDPNNTLEINYGVEIDLNADGFGDFMTWAHPPYTPEWNTATVQVFEDADQDSGGQSSRASDAGFEGNGYETLVFDGASVKSSDPDLAWVRLQEGVSATIQFAFKKSWSGSSFLIGVVSDAGLKDISLYDYNDRFTESEAGSPVRSNPNYPLGMLFAVDNTCWDAYGIQTTGYEPKLCPPILQPTLERPEDSADSPAGGPTSCPVLTCPTFNPLTCGCD